MPYKLLKRNQYLNWVGKLLDKIRVAAPVPKENRFGYAEISSPEELGYQNRYIPTLIPPKKYVFPRTELLVNYNLGDQPQAEPQKVETEPLALLGVKPCDINGLRQLDMVFLEEPIDPHYARRRAGLTIVGMDCWEPCDEYCFCESVGGLSVSSGYDLLFTEHEDDYIISVGSERGGELLAISDAVGDVKPELLEALREGQLRKFQRFPLRLSPDWHSLPLLLTGTYRSKLWEELGAKDLSCGACNMVCPTCSCFDVQDEVGLGAHCGKKLRRWDSCMLEDFAKVGSGENFRKLRAERVRHRILRKFKYQLQRYGESFCVGCGRCARACLVKIDPLKVLNELWERSQQDMPNPPSA